MLFLVSAPSRQKTDKVGIGYPDFSDSDSSLFFELIVDFEDVVKIRLAGLFCPLIFGLALALGPYKWTVIYVFHLWNSPLALFASHYIHILIKDASEVIFFSC